MSLVIDRIQEHYEYASKSFNKDNIIGIFLCGSQNYGTDTPTSDVDTKLLITPTLTDIYLNRAAENTTYHMPESKEQISVKDIRAFIKEIKKQNTNTLELLYTDYCIVNPIYKKTWEQLTANKETLSRYNPILAMKATKGNAANMYSHLFKNGPIISTKRVANLVRYEYYIDHYIAGDLYENCLYPDEETRDYIKQIRSGEMGQTGLLLIADNADSAIKEKVDNFCEQNKDFRPNTGTDDLLNEICREFIDTSFVIEYARRDMM